MEKNDPFFFLGGPGKLSRGELLNFGRVSIIDPSKFTMAQGKHVINASVLVEETVILKRAVRKIYNWLRQHSISIHIYIYVHIVKYQKKNIYIYIYSMGYLYIIIKKKVCICGVLCFHFLSEAFLSSAHGDLCPPSMPVPRLPCQTVLGAQAAEINYLYVA